MIYPSQTNVHVISHNDLDGLCAAAVVKQNFPQASVIITNYNKPIHTNKFKAGDTLFVTDFSLPFELFMDLRKRGLRIVWIDHHVSAINQLTQQGWNCEGIRRTDYSGAMLTWMYFNPDRGFEVAPDVIKLVNWYDLWQHDKDPRIRPFNYGAGLWDLRPGYIAGDKFWNTMFSTGVGDKFLENVVKHGATIQEYVETLQKILCDDLAYHTQLKTEKGMRELMGMCIRPGNSSVFEHMDLHNIDATFTCQYLGGSARMYRCSVYSPDSKKEILDIAQQFGGGGHPTAAGFSSTQFPFDYPVCKTPPKLTDTIAKYQKLYDLREKSTILMRYANRGNGLTSRICGWHSNIEGIKCLAFNYYYLPEMISMIPTSMEIIDDAGDVPDLYVGYVMTNCGYYRCCAYPTSKSVDLDSMLQKLQGAYMKKLDEVCYKCELINDGIWWYAKEPPIHIPINLNIDAKLVP